MGKLPTELVEKIHSSSSKVMSMVTTVQEAVDVAKNSTDIIVAQGAEAGGHRSTFNVDSENEEALPLIGTMTCTSGCRCFKQNRKEASREKR